MSITKVSALYFSPTGTTREAAIAFAEGMRIPVEKIDLTLPRNRQSFCRSFVKDELVVVGLPVYRGRLPKNLDDFFSGLMGNETPAVALVMYGNREYDDALIELKLRLDERGFIVKAGAAFIGEHSFSRNIATGRPDINDLAIARSFGRQTIEAIDKNTSCELTVKGNYPFVTEGYDPTNPGTHPSYFKISTNEKCTQCKLCVENCPFGAIDADDPATILSNKCMRCLRCLKNCPSSAKEIRDEKFLAFLPQFEMRLNAQRCEPELFLPQ